MNSQTYEPQIRHRLTVLAHAQEISLNVAATCRYYGISRNTFYKWERRFKTEGPQGLRERSRAPKNSPNATNSEVVGKIIYLRQQRVGSRTSCNEPQILINQRLTQAGHLTSLTN